MPFTKKINEDRGTLIVEGFLTLENIRNLREELQEALEAVQRLDIDATGAAEADLSFLQLLCSAHRTAVRQGKCLNLTGDLPDVLKQAMEDNGYARQIGCGTDAGKTCLWADR